MGQTQTLPFHYTTQEPIATVTGTVSAAYGGIHATRTRHDGVLGEGIGSVRQIITCPNFEGKHGHNFEQVAMKTAQP
jgi:hypothetical protein